MLQISKRFNVNDSVIKRILKENNITLRTHREIQSKYVDESFFEKIDSEEKAYILGYIYADGCVSNGALQFQCSIKDIDFLNKIKNTLKSEHKITIRINNNGFGIGNQSCLLRIKNEKLISDLNKLGVIPRKSKILKFPSIDQVPNILLRHFIRGYFDGDGSIYSTNYAGAVSFVGTYDFLSGIKNEFQKITNTKANIYKYKNKDIYDYKVGGRNMISTIYEYFYKDATIYLERKKVKFEECIG